MEQVDHLPLGGHLHGPGNHPLAESVERGLLLVDLENQAFMLVFAVPVDIDHAGRGTEDLLDALRQREPLLVAAAVDFCHQGRQHRRSGRNLGDGHGSAVFFRDRRNVRSHAYGDFMALQRPPVFGQQVHLDIGHRRPAAHEIMTDQAVEIVGRCRADIDLVIGGRRVLADHLGHLEGDAAGLFEGRSFGHVENHLELALVVEGQHLDLDHAKIDHRKTGQQQQGDRGEKERSRSSAGKQGVHGPVVKPGQDVIRGVIVVDLGPLSDSLGPSAFRQQANRRPGRDGEGDQHRKDHRR